MVIHFLDVVKAGEPVKQEDVVNWLAEQESDQIEDESERKIILRDSLFLWRFFISLRDSLFLLIHF